MDSSYVAIKCKELNLKTLLVHFDNGWNTEVASKNIEIIQKYTGFDLITHVVDWEEFKILWNSETNPIGWWKSHQLDPVIEK